MTSRGGSGVAKWAAWWRSGREAWCRFSAGECRCSVQTISLHRTLHHARRVMPCVCFRLVCGPRLKTASGAKLHSRLYSMYWHHCMRRNRITDLCLLRPDASVPGAQNNWACNSLPGKMCNAWFRRVGTTQFGDVQYPCLWVLRRVK